MEQNPSEGERVIVEDEIELFKNDKSHGGIQHVVSNEENVHTNDVILVSSEQQETTVIDQNEMFEKNMTQKVENKQHASQIGRPQRERRQLGYLWNYVCDALLLPSNVNSVQKAPAGMAHPLTHYICYSKFSSSHKAFLMAIDSHDEPTSYAHEVKDERWVKAMNKEIKALEENKT